MRSAARQPPRHGAQSYCMSHLLLRFGCRFRRGPFAQVERQFPLRPSKAVVGADDALYQVMADYIAVFEMAEANAVHAPQDLNCLYQSTLLGVGQIDLGDVAGDDRLGVAAEAGKKHLHLLTGGVLGLVHDDEGVIERAAAHKGQRSDFDHVPLEHFVDAVLLQQVIQCVVEGAKIGIYFFLQGSRQEAEAFACFDSGPDQDNAAHLLGQESRGCHGYRQVGLAGAGRTHAEDHVALLDGFEVAPLVDGTWLNHALDARGALFAALDQTPQGYRWIRGDQLEHSVQLAVAEQRAVSPQVFVIGKNP